MLKVAISGNIASGKTTVQKLMLERGYKVLDTDDVSKDLLTVENKELLDAFNDYDVFENEEFSRYKMGQLIFSDRKARKLIAEIMHPQIKEKMLEFFEENSSENIVFVGIPLLFEANMQDLFDKIIFVYTDDDIRLQRLIKRNNYTKEHAISRIQSQMPQDDKIKLSDYVINNNGTQVELENQVIDLLKELIF